MPYLTSVEEIGYERGIYDGEKRGEEKGVEKGQRSFALRLLNRKFGEISDQTRARITALSINQLEALGEALLDFAAIGDLTAWLDENY